jgi:hypothetical protein
VVPLLAPLPAKNPSKALSWALVSVRLAAWLQAGSSVPVLPAQVQLVVLVAASWVLPGPAPLVPALGPLLQRRRPAFSVFQVRLPVLGHKPPCSQPRTKALAPSGSSSPRKPLVEPQEWPFLPL